MFSQQIMLEYTQDMLTESLLQKRRKEKPWLSLVLDHGGSCWTGTASRFHDRGFFWVRPEFCSLGGSPWSSVLSGSWLDLWEALSIITTWEGVLQWLQSSHPLDAGAGWVRPVRLRLRSHRSLHSQLVLGQAQTTLWRSHSFRSLLSIWYVHF